MDSKKTSTHVASINKKLTSTKSVSHSSETQGGNVYLRFAYYIWDFIILQLELILLIYIFIMDGTSGSDLADNQPRTVSPVEPDDGKKLSGIEVKVIPDQTKGVLNKSEKQNAAAAVDDHNTAENKDER